MRGNFLAAFEIFGQISKFLASFGLNFFLLFLRHLLAIEKKSAKINWFILLSECVASRTGPITNASLVLHACPLGKRYHMIRFTKWRTTMSSWEERADEGSINLAVEFEFY